MRVAIVAALPLVVLAGCIDGRPTPLPGPPRMCRAEPAQRFVGVPYRGRTGRAIMMTAEARTFRVVPPNGMVTMDYRPDRVTIELDGRRQVKAVRCG